MASLKEIYYELVYAVPLIVSKATPSIVTSFSGIFPAKSKIIGKDTPAFGISYDSDAVLIWICPSRAIIYNAGIAE